MKAAVITDSSAVLPIELIAREDVHVLDIPVWIDGETYVEGVNLTPEEFYPKMAAAKELPKTSQPSISALTEQLEAFQAAGYTHVLGLFLSSGISGFYQNIQYLVDEFPEMTIAFPDSKITSAPLGMMVEYALDQFAKGLTFETVVEQIEDIIAQTTAFIMVDDLNHLVKGGRLSNGSAIIGNLLSIKPILYFNDEGVITVYEKVRTEKKALRRLVDILKERTQGKPYQVVIIHANDSEKAQRVKDMLQEEGIAGEIPMTSFGAVIGTHLGEGAVAFGICPIVEEISV